jgi:hypothetical protein
MDPRTNSENRLYHVHFGAFFLTFQSGVKMSEEEIMRSVSTRVFRN